MDAERCGKGEKGGRVMEGFAYGLLEDGMAKIERYAGGETRITIHDWIDEHRVVAIGESAFQNQRQLVSVVMHEGIHSIGSRAFSGCASLSCVYLPRSVEHVERDAFDSCPKLKLFVCSESTAHEYARSCGISVLYAVQDLNSAQIEKIVHGIPETYVCGGYVYALNERGEARIDQYKGPMYIDEVIIPEFLDGRRVTEIGDRAFSGILVDRFIVPGSVEHIGRSAFEGCTRTKEIVLTQGVREIGERAFTSSGLECMYFPDTVKRIGRAALCFCRSLREVCLPEGLETIEEETFCGDRVLRSTHIPDSVRLIEALAFADSNHHSKIVMPGLVRHIHDSAFAECSGLVFGVYPDSEGERFARANGFGYDYVDGL